MPFTSRSPSQAPLHKNIEGEYVGDTAASLLSERGGGITGQVIYVDAGYSCVGL